MSNILPHVLRDRRRIQTSIVKLHVYMRDFTDTQQ